jgi:iron(III) transport system substrate-binding protein
MKFLGKKTMALILAGLMAVGMAGCGGKGTDNKASSNDNGKPSGKIVLYTSQPNADAQKLIAAFNKKYPDVKVSVFRSGTEEVISKVMAEKEAGQVQADVLLVADNVTFESLKSKDLLEAYDSPEAKNIPSQYVDKDHMYAGTKIITTGIIVNTSRTKEKITSFADLVKPALKDEVTMPSPLYSGAAAYNLGVLTRTKGIGWDFYKNLKANGVKVDKGNGSIQKAVVAGDKAAGIIVDYMVMRSKKNGAPVEFIYPAEGSPYVTEPIGLLKASKNKAAAKAFIDFILSKEGQEVAAGIGYTPIREDVKAPEGLKGVKDIKPIAANPLELFKERENDKKQFSALFNQ